MFIEIDDKIIDLDRVEAITKDEWYSYQNGIFYQIHFYSFGHAHIVGYKTEEERDKIFVDVVNKFKERTEPIKLTGFAKTLSDLDMSKPMSTHTNKGAKNE